MAGLMNPTGPSMAPMAGPDQTTERAPMGAGGMNGGPQEEQPNVSPEEQQQYNQFVENGMQLMYSEKAMPQILSTLEGDGNPVEGLANATVMTVMRLEQSAQESGKEVSGDVKIHAATELMEQMAELAEEAGIHSYTPEDLEAATYLAMDLYRSARQEQGTLPTDELSQDMSALMQAEQQGQLDQIIPGISQYAQQMQGGA